MKPTKLHHYEILLFLFIASVAYPTDMKADQDQREKIWTTTPKHDSDWHLYPFSIQMRSERRSYNSEEFIGSSSNSQQDHEYPQLALVATTLDLDILYINHFFSNNLESYPRVGLSLSFPYAFSKAWKAFRFPRVWGISAYIELYQSDPSASTWGNRIAVGLVRGSTLSRIKSKPQNIFWGNEEVTYHWQFSKYCQMNFGFGLLFAWWIPHAKHQSEVKKTVTTIETDDFFIKKVRLEDKDSNRIKLVCTPTLGIGIRYTVNSEPFLGKYIIPINYTKRKGSRVDCSVVGSGRYHLLTQKYCPIFRASSLLSFAINHVNALLCTLELGYNLHKKAVLAKSTVPGGMEFTTLLGYEIRYGRFFLQLQVGCELINAKRPVPQLNYVDSDEKNTVTELSEETTGSANFLSERGVFSANVQYMLTELFFMGVTFRYKEVPGIRLGVSL